MSACRHYSATPTSPTRSEVTSRPPPHDQEAGAAARVHAPGAGDRRRREPPLDRRRRAAAADRIEITLDFIPDPGLMIAAATLDRRHRARHHLLAFVPADALERCGFPIIDGVTPGNTRRGKAGSRRTFTSRATRTRPKSTLRSGRRSGGEEDLAAGDGAGDGLALPQIDPRVLRSVQLSPALRDAARRAPSLLDLPDRPAAYDDVGRAVRWGTVLPELQAPLGRGGDAAAWTRERFTACRSTSPGQGAHRVAPAHVNAPARHSRPSVRRSPAAKGADAPAQRPKPRPAAPPRRAPAPRARRRNGRAAAAARCRRRGQPRTSTAAACR